MKTEQKGSFSNEKGIALVTTLMLSLLLSILVAGMLLASTSDTVIGSNDLRNNQAFYIAEAGVNRASGWFTARFGADPNSGLYVLPEKYLNPEPTMIGGVDYGMMGSNTAGQVGKLSYTTGELNYKGTLNEEKPYYKPGVVAGSAEQSIPTSVKMLAGANLQNVVLAGDSTNTYPPSYTVNSLNAAGAATSFTYTNVVSDFTDTLVNQQEGDGTFSVKAILISVLPPPDATQDGTITWLVQSTGRLTRATNTTIASSTIWAYLSARVHRIEGVRTVESTTQVVNADPGVVSRGMVQLGSNTVTIDSYKSSKGQYGITLAGGTYAGQIGAYNKGSRGDVRTNNELINGVYGYLNITNGVVTGNAYSTFFEDGKNGKYEDGAWIEDASSAVLLPPPPGPILIDSAKVMYTQSPAVFFGSADVPADSGHKEYGQAKLTFTTIDPIPPVAAGSKDYSYSTNGNGTLPAGNYKNISVSKGQFTVPPGTYGNMSVSSQGTLVLGVPGQTTTYNFQGFTSGAQTKIIYRGPVVINVNTSLDIGGQGATSDLTTPASAVHWNFKGGNGEVVSVGGGGDTLGVFYAPNNDLIYTGNGDFYGAIAARNVTVKGTGALHIDQDALLPVTTTKKVVVTATIIVGYTATNYSLWRITQDID
ncbi:MAG: PilX N-terminal domain-containing pilus assembly protein [Acidobacteriota bacterium]